MDPRIPPDAGTGTGTTDTLSSTGLDSSSGSNVLQAEVARPKMSPPTNKILAREPLTSDHSSDKSSDTTSDRLEPGDIQQLSEEDARKENERAAEKIKHKLKPMLKLNAVRRSIAHSPHQDDPPKVLSESPDLSTASSTDSSLTDDTDTHAKTADVGADKGKDKDDGDGKRSRLVSLTGSKSELKRQSSKAKSSMLIDLEPARLVDAQTVAGDRRYFQCPGDPEPEGDFVYDFLYQHQRGAFFLGTPKFSSKSLLPVDPDEWTDQTFQTSAMDTSDYELPDPNWEWVYKSWLVDMTGDVDEDGWEYAMTFHGSPWHGNYEIFRSFARRRRWLRLRKRKGKALGKPGALPERTYPPSVPSISQSQLDATIALQQDASPYSTVDRKTGKSISTGAGSLSLPFPSAKRVDLYQSLKKSHSDREKLAHVAQYVVRYPGDFDDMEKRMDKYLNLFDYETSRREFISMLMAYGRGQTMEAIEQRIKEQGDKVRSLKSSKADKDVITAEVATLNELKAELKALTLNDPSAAPANKPAKTDDKKGKGAFTLKNAKGTKDYTPQEMAVREKIFSTIIGVFKKHGGITIDTPVFELKEILSGKYGEDSKLIYDLEDQGGEKCSLRYDLTVPFARFLAMNGKEYQNIKRYHIAKVYRRDQPAMTKGRMREFFQCDFDIAGTYDSMIPDSEILRVLTECLTALGLGDFTIKLNHRKILDGIFEVCGVPEDKIRTISSAVDKLDKLPWADVRKEMTEDKGLDPKAADLIGEYVQLKGGAELLERLYSDAKLGANTRAKEGLDDMTILFKYLDVLNVTRHVSFDLSLARGLDYYTGLIYEAVLEGSAPPTLANGEKARATVKKGTDELDESTVGVGSIAAGGRYDNLVGMFSGTNKKGQPNLVIPCVGISIGVERVFSILMQKQKKEQIKSNEVEVYVVGLGGVSVEARMKICTELWDAGIKAEFAYKLKPRTQNQWDVCDRDMIPFAVIVGGDEVEKGLVKIKDMRSKDESQKGGLEYPRTEMIAEIKRRLAEL
ncbi:Cytoplasmic and mitochondrial histidine tRNA synthetase [Mortierella sp. 14UC]|nr:Cytoplasmic and mitochondrial histidine tRNA synthetase [Mortierella sp. 14UC]